MELNTLKTLWCERCCLMTEHVFEEHWYCLCGLATDGADRQVTEGETV
jgi:hypothetical protein